MLIIRPEAICNSSSADYDCAIVFLPLISSAAPVLQKTVIVVVISIRSPALFY